MLQVLREDCHDMSSMGTCMGEFLRPNGWYPNDSTTRNTLESESHKFRLLIFYIDYIPTIVVSMIFCYSLLFGCTIPSTDLAHELWLGRRYLSSCNELCVYRFPSRVVRGGDGGIALFVI